MIRECGCTVDELKWHVERQFKEGMKWETHGAAWQIVSIKAAMLFKDHDDPATVEQHYHWSNLAPEWIDDNRRRGWMYAVPGPDGRARYPFYKKLKDVRPVDTFIGEDRLPHLLKNKRWLENRVKRDMNRVDVEYLNM
jgi:hypothetical protein